MHSIKPTIKKFPLDMEGTDKACEYLDHNDMRYRGILIPQD